MGDSVKPWIGPEGKHSASNPTFPHSVKRKEKHPGSCEWVLCEHMRSRHSGPHVRGSSFSVCPTAGRRRHQVQPSSFCTTVHIRKRVALLECVLPPKPLDSLGLFFPNRLLSEMSHLCWALASVLYISCLRQSSTGQMSLSPVSRADKWNIRRRV